MTGFRFPVITLRDCSQKEPAMSGPTLAKGWHILLSYPKEKTAKPATWLIWVTGPASESGFCEAEVIDTGEKIHVRLVYFGGPEVSGGKYGAEIPLPEKGPGWHRYFAYCRAVTEKEARNYCGHHDLNLPPHERDGFRSRIARFFGG